MINPFPFFGFPRFNSPPPYFSKKIPHMQNKDIPNKANVFGNTNHNYFQVAGSYSKANSVKPNSFISSTTIDKSEDNVFAQAFDNNNENFFEILGLKLYFDDLLIISLLFFLYQEDVKDTYLYIALILLLIS